MKARLLHHLLLVFVVLGSGAVVAGEIVATDSSLGRVEVSTVPWDPDLDLRTATYTPSGKVLVVYNQKNTEQGRQVNLAVMDDDGTNMKTFFSGTIPYREKDNGLRYMIFPDNQRIFLGDFVIECAPNLDDCARAELVPVAYPPAVAGGEHVSHRWSEIIVSPDNRHIAWTTLFANYSAMVFTGELTRGEDEYTIDNPVIVSPVEPFEADPDNPGGAIPRPVRNGEVKQFVDGGRAISMAGALRRDTADSVVVDLPTGELEQITDTPGYNETTIFSPDEELGITMTTRFSEQTNMAILGLVPRPYPASLNMGLNMHTYTYSVPGVREARSGNIGPALIDIAESKAGGDYRGINLNTTDEWVYHSPMSWHPDGKKAMWLEGLRGEKRRRMQVVHLPDHEPSAPVAAKGTPSEIPYGTDDLSVVENVVERGSEVSVTVHGRHSGYIDYRRSEEGLIEKTYVDFSDDGERTYDGVERMQLNPAGQSVYTADVKLTGPEAGEMDLQITFGPLSGDLPARLIFVEDESGKPQTRGHARYGDRKRMVEDLIP